MWNALPAGPQIPFCTEDLLSHPQYFSALQHAFLDSPRGKELFQQQNDIVKLQRMEFLLFAEKQTGSKSKELEQLRKEQPQPTKAE